MSRLIEIGRTLLAILPPRSVWRAPDRSTRRMLAAHAEMEHAVAVLRAFGWTAEQAHEATQQALQEEIDFVRSTIFPFSEDRLRQRLYALLDRAASGELPSPDPPG